MASCFTEPSFSNDFPHVQKDPKSNDKCSWVNHYSYLKSLINHKAFRNILFKVIYASKTYLTSLSFISLLETLFFFRFINLIKTSLALFDFPLFPGLTFSHRFYPSHKESCGYAGMLCSRYISSMNNELIYSTWAKVYLVDVLIELTAVIVAVTTIWSRLWFTEIQLWYIKCIDKFSFLFCEM